MVFVLVKAVDIPVVHSRDSVGRNLPEVADKSDPMISAAFGIKRR